MQLGLEEYIVAFIYFVFMMLFGMMFRMLFIKEKFLKRHFLPGLALKLLGAVALGMIYDFVYHSSGDTFMYNHDGKVVSDALLSDFSTGLRLLFVDTNDIPLDLSHFAGKMSWLTNKACFFVVRVIAVLHLISFQMYLPTALFFGLIGFIGNIWCYKFISYWLPYYRPQIIVVVFYFPSLIFWGSGILKDTLSYTALMGLLYGVNQIIVQKKIRLRPLILICVGFISLLHVKLYILASFLPGVLIIAFLGQLQKIKSKVLKYALYPFILGVSVVLLYFSVQKMGEENASFAAENIANTSKTSAEWNEYSSRRNGGQGASYSLGKQDGTLAGMLKLAPAAINVALFRPYPWEAGNAMRLLSSLESTFLLLLTLNALLRNKIKTLWKTVSVNPYFLFTLVSTLILAFAVGISSYNFGSLVRYRIPFLPFFTVMLLVLDDHSKRPLISHRLFKGQGEK